MRNKYVYIVLLSTLGIQLQIAAQTISEVPRLVVNIVIDQMTTDQLDFFSTIYSKDGLRCVLEEGAVYTDVSHNFSPTDYSSAIASLYTGTTPYYNGIIASEWLDRKTLRQQSSIEPEKGDISPVLLLTSTLSDELKIASKGLSRIYSFATKADAAVFSAGHTANGAVWLQDDQWHLTSYYSVDEWLRGYTRLYKPQANITEALTSIAVDCIAQAGIGIDTKPDLINIVYPKITGLEDVSILDHCIAKILSAAETKVGKRNLLIVITSTGYTNDEQIDYTPYRIPSGTLDLQRTVNLLNIYLGAKYGYGRYVDGTHRQQLYLNHSLLEKKNISIREAQESARDFLLQVTGIRNVYTAHQLATSESPLFQRIRNGFNYERSGDLIIEAAPGWKVIEEPTSTMHTTNRAVVRFPVIFYGGNITCRRIETPVTADRIAPTIARFIHIRAPNGCSSAPLH